MLTALILPFHKKYESVANVFNFGSPGNDAMYTLISLFAELMFIGIAIVYLLFEVFEVIIDEFGSDFKRVASHFTSELESFLDIFFLLFPTAVILYILVPTLGYIYSEELIPDTGFTIVITVTGHQWYWTYQYIIGEANIALDFVWNVTPDIEFDAVLLQEIEKYRLLEPDNTVFFPVCTRILLQITSDDVIHSWALPQLGIKTDAVPGRLACVLLFADIQSSWYGQCSELCGAYHAFMPVELTSLSSEVFFKIWVISSIDYQLYDADADIDEDIIINEPDVIGESNDKDIAQNNEENTKNTTEDEVKF